MKKTFGMLLGALAFVAAPALADTPTTQRQAQQGADTGNYPVNTVKGWNVTCGNTATDILAASGNLSGARSVTLTNVSDTTLRLGGSEVTNGVGYQLAVGASVTITLDTQSATAPTLNCAVSGGAKTLSVLGAK